MGAVPQSRISSVPAKTRQRRASRRPVGALRQVERIPAEAVLLADTSLSRIPAGVIARSGRGDPGREAHLAHLFIDRNGRALEQFKIEARVDYDGNRVYLVFQSGSAIGAFPLVSPLSGKAEVSLIVRPRFGWMGLGASLGMSGFKVIPQILPLGLLPKTEREIPSWVMSAAVLPRLKAMIERLSRRFEMVDDVRSAPCGRVDWAAYATEKLPAMKFLSVPCRHPDLIGNRELRAAIHFTLRKQLAGLESQRHSGGAVLVLMQLCLDLLRAVDDVPPVTPTRRQLEGWFRTPLATSALFDGLNAITWTTDETGLGGATDWRGLPWSMSMEEFYEAWVETVFEGFARRFGGLLRVGRRKETITPIAWERAYLGSQKFLLPDLVIEQEDRVIFVDAKYKDHWEELRQHRWMDLEEEIRERHREDLLQVLAYSTLSDRKATTACLAYPCKPETWNSLKDRGMLSHRGAIYAGRRKIDLVLVAVPIGNRLDELVHYLGTALAA
jgi:hypothetical protein